jgi:hypothetical protein
MRYAHLVHLDTRRAVRPLVTVYQVESSSRVGLYLSPQELLDITACKAFKPAMTDIGT